MAPDPFPGATLAWGGDVDDRPRVGADHPESGSRPVAQDCFRSRSQNRCHPPSLPRDHSVAHRVDAGVQGIEAVGVYPSFDLPAREAEREELAPGDDPVLVLGEIRNRLLPGLRFARPQQSTYPGDWSGLGGHPARLTGDSARVLRRLRRLSHAMRAKAGPYE